MKYPECEVCGKWSPRLSFIGNSAISVFKFVVGILTGSKGLVADGIHSVADAISSLFVLIALKISSKPKDKGHPFGHGKIEYISTISASIFIFICATMIFIDALHSFKSGVREVPENAAILATVLALIFSYLMYSSNTCSGEQLNSPALLADAAESKADSLTSVAVLLGLIGTKIGYTQADTVAAAVVALFVFHISVEMFLKGVNGLIDVSMDKEVITTIVDLCMKIDGVEGVKSVKSRCMGQKCAVDVNIDVSSKETVLSVHNIAEQIKKAITLNIDEIDEVFVKAQPIGKWRFWGT
ncbi:cation diffusion facilitator family transporter [Candidatus Magnetobacterium casense]|uniref:Cation transporter n=1 Tax=Candidatus Magnetobacterium casense TaxID=1455061 RepID=A0ABS6RVU9_9BACT|nr:cation diffusion facilitator family transporter [Candidatus Magnetobacterium casensis]MBV6340753.1 cation transporter [Candidatus Magnetobacterium casensis]